MYMYRARASNNNSKTIIPINDKQITPSTTIYLWLIPLTASKELSILLLKLLE